MNNRVKIFMESASQMGVGKPELEALTKLFKVCLESALEDEESPDYYDSDTRELDISEYGINPSDDATEDIDIGDQFDLYSHPDIKDEMNEFNPDEETLNTPVESTAGTTLTDSYIKAATNLLDSNQCNPSDMSNLGNFIDWLIKKFNSFDSRKYMEQAESMTKDRKHYNYDSDRMDKCLNVIEHGTSVVQLLRDIKEKFGKQLDDATITNETSLFAVAKGINDFVAERFAGIAEDIDSQSDNNVVTYEKGFYNTDDDSREATTSELRDAPKTQVSDDTNNKTDGNPTDNFPADWEVEEVDKAIADFVNFIPSSNLSDKDAAKFNKPVKKEAKKKLKTVASKRGEVSKMYNGDVVDANAWKKADEDDLWADL